jgi:hypothetical protein
MKADKRAFMKADKRAFLRIRKIVVNDFFFLFNYAEWRRVVIK